MLSSICSGIIGFIAGGMVGVMAMACVNVNKED